MLQRMLCGLLLLGMLTNLAQADDESGSWRPRGRFDLDPRTGIFGYHNWAVPKEPLPPAERLARAGSPQSHLPWASCQNESRRTGYYVGGGAPFFGEPRNHQQEGTWGWDYKLPLQRVNLGWWHGRRTQGGEGQYNADAKNNPVPGLSE